ncbi:hypothetical protein [Flavobacterium sp.]|uniref:hypothetical protein n=1 Tax=Flavobacterium sp. TaxID=239 RepID=UPI00262A4EFB|nr:hypothetical protein [Flavobacterium sp.]
MKKIALFLFIVFSNLSFAQASLNDYEMALIPSKFDFQKEDNQFRINSTIKAFLKQKGFEVYLSNDVLPEGFTDYNCNKVFVNVVEENSMFLTKLKVEFKDCHNVVLFTTDVAESKIKELGQAYNQALLTTLKSFDKAKYKFSGKTYYDQEAQEKLKGREVENVSEEVTKVIKSEKEVKYEKVEKAPKPENNQPFVKVINKITNEAMVLYKTTRSAIYLCDLNEKSGVVFAKNEVWFFEYLENDKLVSEKLDIKF